MPNILATPIAPVALPASSDPACASVAFVRSLPGACVGPEIPGRCRSHAGCSVPPSSHRRIHHLAAAQPLPACRHQRRPCRSVGWVGGFETQTGVASLLAPTPPQRHRSSLRCVSHRVRQSEHPAAVFTRLVVRRAVPSAVMPHGARRVIRTCVIVMSHLKTTRSRWLSSSSKYLAHTVVHIVLLVVLVVLNVARCRYCTAYTRLGTARRSVHAVSYAIGRGAIH